MQVWNVVHAARWKYRTQKSPKSRHLGIHRTTLSGYVFAIKALIGNRKKNLLSSNIFSICPHNMVNFGPLAAEIGPVVWGTPANFNEFTVLAAYIRHTSIGCQPNFAALNRGRHLYSAGRPSRWARILVVTLFFGWHRDRTGGPILTNNTSCFRARKCLLGSRVSGVSLWCSTH